LPEKYVTKDGEALYRCNYCGLVWTQESSNRPGFDAKSIGGKMGDVHKIINFYLYNDLFSCRDGRISIALSFSCSGEVDESSIYIGPYELNANSISDIKTLKTLKEYKWHGPFSSLNRREPKGREKGPEKSRKILT
jgi:hypothetical protein